jgi:hypothetical protein
MRAFPRHDVPLPRNNQGAFEENSGHNQNIQGTCRESSHSPITERWLLSPTSPHRKQRSRSPRTIENVSPPCHNRQITFASSHHDTASTTSAYSDVVQPMYYESFPSSGAEIFSRGKVSSPAEMIAHPGYPRPPPQTHWQGGLAPPVAVVVGEASGNAIGAEVVRRLMRGYALCHVIIRCCKYILVVKWNDVITVIRST